MTPFESIILGVYILCCIFSFFEKEQKGLMQLFGMSVLLVILISICTFKPVHILWDAEAYISRYKHLVYGEMGSEPLSFLLIYITRPFNNYIVMFFVYALLSVGIKFITIWRYTPLIFLSIAIFISNMFLVQDLIQIRVAVATGILLLSLPYLFNKNLTKFLFCLVVATMFHYSAVVWICTYALNPYRINKKFWIFLLVGGYVLAVVGLSFAHLIEIIPVDDVQNLYKAYTYKLEVKGHFDHLNIFNKVQLLNIAVLTFVMIKLELLMYKNKYTIILTKIFMIAMLMYVLLSDIPVVAVRLSELMQIVGILLFPLTMYAFKQNKVGILVVLSIGSLFLFEKIITNSLYY